MEGLAIAVGVGLSHRSLPAFVCRLYAPLPPSMWIERPLEKMWGVFLSFPSVVLERDTWHL